MKRRLAKIRREIHHLLDDLDVFGLKPKNQSPLKLNVEPQAWRFMKDSEKVESFNNWLTERTEEGVLEVGGDGNPWSSEYVNSAYRKGLVRSYVDTRKVASGLKPADWYQGGREEFLRGAFAAPETKDKLQLLYTRSFEDLKGFTEEMGTQTSRILTDGLANGRHPSAIARSMSDNITSLQKKRALTIARTEIIHAHAEGQLDGFERLGVDEVGVFAEWQTAGDNRVCPLCSALEGVVFSVKEARGMIPRHPNCRCAYLPSQVGEGKSDKASQKVSMKGKKAAVQESISLEGKKSKWVGAEKAGDLKSIWSEQDKMKAALKAKAKAKAGPAPTPTPSKPKTKPSPKPKTKPSPKPKTKPEPKKPKPKPKSPSKPEPKIPDTSPPSEPLPETALQVPPGLPNPAMLEKVEDLPGSTRPVLMKSPDGKQWVVKSYQSDINPDHLRSEALADELYRTIGAPVPKGGIIETAEGPMKITEFLEHSSSLKKRLSVASPEIREDTLKALQENFVADALFANWDVVGLEFDNVLKHRGTFYRVDNGGALMFRAQGARKANFGKRVDELTSLRDPAINSQTAEIFGSITDEEIYDQIGDLLEKRTAILGKIDDPELKSIMAQRLDDLAERRPSFKPAPPKPSPKPAADDLAAMRADTDVTEETVERIKDSGALGRTISGDRGDVEDMNLLVWEDLDEFNEKILVVEFKTTFQGSNKIKQYIESAIGSHSWVSPEAIAGLDRLGSKINNLARALAQTERVTGFERALSRKISDGLEDLEILLSQEGRPELFEKGLNHYKESFAYLSRMFDEPPGVRRALEVPKKFDFKQPPVAGKDAIFKPTYEIEEKARTFEKGKVTSNNATSAMSGRTVRPSRGAYQITKEEEGVSVSHVLRSYTSTEQSDLALQGRTRIEIKGGASVDNLRKAYKSAEDMGIKFEAADLPEFEEMLYIHRSIYARQMHRDPEYHDIFTGDLPPAEKVKKMKDWVKSNMGIDLENAPPPGYDPKGFLVHGTKGERRWTRWDYSEEEIEKLKNTNMVLQHTVGDLMESPAGILEKFIPAALDSGGSLLSTTERIRKGINIRAGSSVSLDIKSGGASYTFTRLKDLRATDVNGLFFKRRTLLRQDSFSYDEDSYGNVNDLVNRATDMDSLLDFRYQMDNETMHKSSLSLIHDIDFIRVSSNDERKAVIKAYKDRGHETLPDGRKIEDVVVTRSSTPSLAPFEG
jgi:SPP1 gp7 family putative phage head morphogenesis protein